MNTAKQTLYDLLPAIHRLRDAENNDALKSYLQVFEQQIAILQENIDQLYDDQFIETCEDWVVPYIGDLIGYKPLHNIQSKQVSLRLSQRAEVANTLAYRRRKGTALVLEQLARDVTGWPAKVSEFFQTLATTQYMNHVRSHNHYATSMRDWASLQTIDTAFDSNAHTADVRHIDTDKGRHNIKNIGLFLWRLQSYSLSKSPLLPVEPGHYYFSPLQHDIALYNKPVAELDITHIAEPVNVPHAIQRRSMHADKGLFYGDGKSVQLYDGFNAGSGDFDAVAAGDVEICCLANTQGDWINDPDGSSIAIDPESGRLALGPDLIADDPLLWADFHYGFSANMGSGEYERSTAFGVDSGVGNFASVDRTQTLQSGLSALAGEGVVEISDSSRYQEAPIISVSADASIQVRAANQHRPFVLLEDELLISGADNSTVILDGLLIAGANIRVPAADNGLEVLHLRHCALVPGLNLDTSGDPINAAAPSIIIESANVKLIIDRCIIGAVHSDEGAEIVIQDSIIDANDREQVAYAALDGESPGAPLHITDSTVIGKLHTRIMRLASNCIFDAQLAPADDWVSPVQAQRKQQGCVRFSYVPRTARLPRRYRCQPEFAINQTILRQDAAAGVAGLSSAQKADISTRLSRKIKPVYSSGRYDEPAYCQLAQSCAIEIRQGADDESEMGAFHDLYQPQRETNLKLRLREYLRFGLEAGIFYET